MSRAKNRGTQVHYEIESALEEEKKNGGLVIEISTGFHIEKPDYDEVWVALRTQHKESWQQKKRTPWRKRR